jgi:tripartite-type tricarboxylate transporter receptor subunit TctC
MQRRTLLSAASAAFAAAVAPHAMAQAAWPSRSITMVVPFPPGGVADTVARPVADAMSRELGQTVVVENRAGAGGGIGMAYVAKAPADGYTVLMALSSITVIPEADGVLGRSKMYSLDALRPVARFTADPTVLAVRADAPWKTVKDFIDDARAHPGTINYGSSGNYGTMHVPMEMLSQQAGIKLTHIPYTGAGPAVVALLGGQIQAVSSGPATVLQHVKAGKLRVLAHWGDGKLETMPEVPSLKQSGHDVQYAQWSGMFVPAGTPEAVVQRLRDAARKAANDPKVKQTILGAGSPILYMDAPEFTAYVQQDAKKMAEVVKKIGKVQ